jgi:alkylation response protein AidB-like acyl-CoA dehydrogenase
MDLNFSPAETAFREEVRGWGGPGWPKEFGGPGWTPTEQYIFEEECAAGGAPRLISFGLKMVAPVLMAFGNPAQQQRFLPKICRPRNGGARAIPSPAPAPTSPR